jgi:hypothetical protein
LLLNQTVIAMQHEPRMLSALGGGGAAAAAATIAVAIAILDAFRC